MKELSVLMITGIIGRGRLVSGIIFLINSFKDKQNRIYSINLDNGLYRKTATGTAGKGLTAVLRQGHLVWV